MQGVQLTPRDEARIEELLESAPVVNLFLAEHLAKTNFRGGYWYGVSENARLIGCALVLPNRLTVPWCPRADAAKILGDTLAQRHAPTMCVGPREAVDHLFRGWSPQNAPRRTLDQRLYTLSPPLTYRGADRLRKAKVRALDDVIRRDVAMWVEDIGINPLDRDPDDYLQAMEQRLRAGKVLVLEHERQPVFQVTVGVTSPLGAQIGGTYVPPAWRGQGWCCRGIAAVTHLLLKKHPVVSLHVNEANLPARKCYERVGFKPDAAYRVLTV